MKRLDHSARCALLALPEGWELCVLVDGESLLAERCTRADEAFELAARWKRRMLDQGWQQVIPRHTAASGLDGRLS